MVFSMDRWIGKVAVVTGASDGIGAAIVKELLDNGVIVVGMARRKEKIQELSKSKNLYSLKVDFRKQNEIIKAFKWVNNNVGSVYILINSVGTAWVTSAIHVQTKLWKDQLDTDFYGFLIPTGEVIKEMIVNNIDGHIIHIGGSTGHDVSLPNFSAVSAGKSAVTATANSLKQELILIKRKIKITLVSPGLVKSELVARNADKQKSLLNSANILGKFAALQPSDVAAVVIYVLSTPPHVQVENIRMRAIGSPF
ncbi:hypothetical protein RN001_008763 [Aquatica leii]|uniref:Farnesol dehydrogenase-like n=1 Tax=Aquatica leii TaxID=1421715 RepID=A0AAN7PA15_9COLE|nr:hypothetical protein RN001_008763 [Aquatica leii]